jgi:hypothetical protein
MRAHRVTTVCSRVAVVERDPERALPASSFRIQFLIFDHHPSTISQLGISKVAGNF